RGRAPPPAGPRPPPRRGPRAARAWRARPRSSYAVIGAGQVGHGPPTRRCVLCLRRQSCPAAHAFPATDTGGVWFVRTARCVPSCPLPAAHDLKREIVIGGGRWSRCPLGAVLGGPELDRDVLVTLTLPALHRVGPRVHPEALAADRAASPQVRVLLAVA